MNTLQSNTKVFMPTKPLKGIGSFVEKVNILLLVTVLGPQEWWWVTNHKAPTLWYGKSNVM